MNYLKEKQRLEADLKARKLRLNLVKDQYNSLQHLAENLAVQNFKDEARIKELNDLIMTEVPTLAYNRKILRAAGILLLMIPTFLFAQVQVDFGVGAARLNKGLPTGTTNDGQVISSRNLFYTLNISAQYKINNVVVGGDFIPEFGGSVANTPTYYGLKAGYSIGSFTPAIGYYRAHVSSDNPDLNKYVVGYSLDYYKEVGEQGGYFIRGMYINNSFMAAIGARININ